MCSDAALDRTSELATSAVDLAMGWAATQDEKGRGGVWIRTFADGAIAFSKTPLKRRLKGKGITLKTVLPVWARWGWASNRIVRIGHGVTRCVVLDPNAVGPLPCARPTYDEAIARAKVELGRTDEGTLALDRLVLRLLIGRAEACHDGSCKAPASRGTLGADG